MFPEELKQHKRWMCFKIIEGKDKPEKVPYSPKTGGFASVTDPTTWVDYMDAAAAMQLGQYDSIGFVLGKEVGLTIVDFDKVVEKSGDPWPEWVMKEIEELDSYTEVSASGRGLHVLVWGLLPGPNMNRQKCHVELWDCNRMFALSGLVLEGRDVVQSRDVSKLYERVAAGRIGPQYKPSIIAERWDSQKFRDVCNDQWDQHGLDSRSAAVQSALVTLCMKYPDDAQVRTEFEKTELCHAWEERGKWSRLAEREIERAREFAGLHKTSAPAEERLELKFSKPAVRLDKSQYVMLPKDSKFDGWFRRGSIALVGGASGAGKTTLLFALLQAQSQGEEYMGHKGAGLPFLVLFADRTLEEMTDTIERMELPADFPAAPLRISWGAAAAAAILDAIEQHNVPPVVFIEGGDTLVEDASKVQCVAIFLSLLQQIAHHYGLAMILSVGSPKSSPQGGYKLARDRVFGSQVWARMAGTVATLTMSGDGTETQRELIVQHRNAKAEKVNLTFHNGRFIVDTNVEPTKAEQERQRRIRHFSDFDGNWFDVTEFMAASGLAKSRSHDFLVQMSEEGVLKRKKDGKKWQYRLKTALEAANVVSSEGIEL
jgi:energy-coupling factor transporter ATP-binding protein EcfA2